MLSPAGLTVAELLSQGKPLFSFEFFPPRTAEEVPRLLNTVAALAPLAPDFVSITYGANGSRRDRTMEATREIARIGNPMTVGHLTCVDQSKSDVANALALYREVGVRNILAVRGDMPGGGRWRPHPDGLRNATELVEFVKSEGDFCVGVAAFVSPHPETNDADLDARILLDKVAAGADYAITQLFFDTADYFALVNRMQSLGCGIPIIAGLMPLTAIRQIERFEALSGAPLPADFVAGLRAADPADVRSIGISHAKDMCRILLDGGAPGLQFFTQNRAKATREVLAAVRGQRN
ncbi:methylenetetrahydrofolate reductase [Tessaracoccus sp. OH4464_COT-324]|uniref:methylenetetrahydrofolate reductase n=1 Tax=Tessaracoccus sp. OH4464_COT-324 TaxID=2491059 RepID=UPI000F63325D|nr:methylenetetrahydrofolate reductase [Tessaracoccus sp. OH4464_COT-324]RRD47559.1 5,10-methylenetetrahydrofolate reductase [Tessaracoccus sp. OH4464_COT-324]